MWKLGTLWFGLRKELALAWAMLRDPSTPVASRLAILAAVAYVLSPIDLVSDLIPILGWIDDGVVAVLLLRLAARWMPGDLYQALKSRVERNPPRRDAR
ncbi:DUF1232 domain-containing protein [Variovorax dokdonensis]|uniref:DUF1232 domain-containing protein n=1 Tax=Variovorax dokdonensis TaxID=344883 RepID=A0ABT7NCZ2_9BURK|nr:DUF1232 domain-containing protein [Variovorax dokdonensis]MDM0045807.1 DUF1232 domain-containing protein [Variovorax dokdonensis]